MGLHVVCQPVIQQTHFLEINNNSRTRNEYIILWENPTSLQAAPFRPPLSTCTNLLQPFLGPQLKTPTTHRSVYSDQSRVSLF